MTSYEHEEFEAFCALSSSGNLTESEWQRLDEHLSGCETCRQAMAEYDQVVSEIIPAVAAAKEAELPPADKSRSLEDAERRLMARLDQSTPAPPERLHSTLFRSKLPIVLLIAASIALVFMGYERLNSRSRELAKESRPPDVLLPVPSYSGAGPGQVGSEASLRAELERTQAELASIRKTVSVGTKALEETKARLKEDDERLALEQTAVQRVSAERDALSQQLATAQAENHTWKEVQDRSSETAKAEEQKVAVLAERIRSLSSALEQKDHVLSEDRELLAHDRDIRDLIGARNLYMAEIYDVAQTGETKKPFGRVFYTKDKSLVFYGYDLDQQPGLKRSVTFQAWGKGAGEQNVSLGLFYQDESKRRWILKFDDAGTLARLNSVFVTAEPVGGSVKPTGKPLLTTYLRLDPNHP